MVVVVVVVVVRYVDGNKSTYLIQVRLDLIEALGIAAAAATTTTTTTTTTTIL